MRLLALVAALGLVSATTVGCASPSDQDGTNEEDNLGEDESAETATRYDPNNLLADADIWTRTTLTEGRLQQFLESEGSYLARYRDGSGRSAARIIIEESQSHGVNPVYILARIQGESSLIESGRSTNLSAATGCGCPDGASCSRQQAGFSAQVECAAELMEDYRNEMRADGTTRSGWGVGRAKRSLDPCSVTPRNMATAALYTYTPWVGSRGSSCGARSAGGSSLITHIYKKYEGLLGL